MIPKWLGEHRALGGFVNDGYFIDIGIPNIKTHAKYTKINAAPP